MYTPADDPDGSTGERGATVSCPPFCPGDLDRLSASYGASVVPFVNDSTFSPALQSSVTSSAVVVLQTATPGGLSYTPSCNAIGIFTDPSTGICSSEAESASYQCAFGSIEGTCSLCPDNALCPGGYVQWPRAGFYAVSEAAEIKVRGGTASHEPHRNPCIALACLT